MGAIYRRERHVPVNGLVARRFPRGKVVIEEIHVDFCLGGQAWVVLGQLLLNSQHLLDGFVPVETGPVLLLQVYQVKVRLHGVVVEIHRGGLEKTLRLPQALLFMRAGLATNSIHFCLFFVKKIIDLPVGQKINEPFVQ